MIGSGPQLARVIKTTGRLPTSMMLHSIPGWGKTSFAAQSPSPIFLMVGNEIGLRTLLSNGILANIAHFPEPAQTFNEVKLAVHELIVHDHDYKTLVIDVFNEVERLAFEEAIHDEYGGKRERFFAFGSGPKTVAQNDIPELLTQLDSLRTKKGMSIILLNHTSIAKHKNPEGDDYNYYAPALEKGTMDAVNRWADVVLFGQHEVYVSTERGKTTKATGGEHRIIKTTHNAAWVAKNRMNLPPVVDGGNSAAEAWANFVQAIKANKSEAS